MRRKTIRCRTHHSRVVRGSILCDPTQPNTTNNEAYSLVVTHFYTQSLCRTFCQRSILPYVLYCHYTYENSVIMTFKNKLFKEMLKMSSAATQKASKFLVLLLQWTQPNPTHGSTQPMDNSAPQRRHIPVTTTAYSAKSTLSELGL